MSAKRDRSGDGKASPPRNWDDIAKLSMEELVSEAAKDLPPNRELEYFSYLQFEHDIAPPRLFHYTSEESAKNIIRTNSLWASDAYELEDRREVAYPCSLLRTEIKRRHAHFLGRGEHLFADLCSKLEEALVTPRDCYPAVFVACLTENIGSKKHWEEYSSHEGYALGFKFETPWTLGLFVPPGKGARPGADAIIRKVVYNPTLQRQMLAHVLDTFLVLFSKTMLLRAGAGATESLPAHLAKPFVEDFKDFASRVVASIKAPRYRHEREWRIVVAHWPGSIESDFRRPTSWIRQRCLSGGTRRYVPLVPEQGGLLPLCSMIAGRGCSADARKRVGDLLRKSGHAFPAAELGTGTS